MSQNKLEVSTTGILNNVINDYKRDTTEFIRRIIEYVENTEYELIHVNSHELIFYRDRSIEIIELNDIKDRFAFLINVINVANMANVNVSDTDIQQCIKEMEDIEFSFIARLGNGLLFRRLIDEMEYSFILNKDIIKNI